MFDFNKSWYAISKFIYHKNRKRNLGRKRTYYIHLHESQLVEGQESPVKSNGPGRELYTFYELLAAARQEYLTGSNIKNEWITFGKCVGTREDQEIIETFSHKPLNPLEYMVLKSILLLHLPFRKKSSHKIKYLPQPS